NLYPCGPLHPCLSLHRSGLAATLRPREGVGHGNGRRALAWSDRGKRIRIAGRCRRGGRAQAHSQRPTAAGAWGVGDGSVAVCALADDDIIALGETTPFVVP